jgi:predicted MPP superfamily phosphohydrolase
MPLLRLRSDGRGKHYSVARGLLESALRVLYVRDWPAVVWASIPSVCDVERSSVTLKYLPPGSSRIRFGFVSDLHIGPTTPVPLLDRAFGLLANADLDVLLLGGDYVFLDATAERMARLTSLAARVPARRRFAVLGNHDLWAQDSALEEALAAAGVEVLCNTSRSLRIGTANVALVGLDDPWFGQLDVARAFQDVSGSQAVVVLCHSPEAAPFVEDEIGRSSLSLPVFYVCGHTHGGQIATPWGAIRRMIPGVVGRRMPQGLHEIGPIDLYVSRGVGGVDVPIRTYARPEVVIVDLVPTDS